MRCRYCLRDMQRLSFWRDDYDCGEDCLRCLREMNDDDTAAQRDLRPSSWTDSTGLRLEVHPRGVCFTPTACAVHHPSQHHMRDWPIVWRGDRRIMERACPHGIGHPDPDDLAYRQSLSTYTGEGVHGCDGCCRADEQLHEAARSPRYSGSILGYCHAFLERRGRQSR